MSASAAVAHCPPLPEFADDAARHYAEIRADLKRRGALIGANDLFLAAHARALGLTLEDETIHHVIPFPAAIAACLRFACVTDRPGWPRARSPR